MTMFEYPQTLKCPTKLPSNASSIAVPDRRKARRV
jgi:hypothetical protein